MSSQKTQVQDLIQSAYRAAHPSTGCLWAALEILKVAKQHAAPGSVELLRIMQVQGHLLLWHKQPQGARILFASALEQAELHDHEELCKQLKDWLCLDLGD